jgi:hypothetical protein
MQPIPTLVRLLLTDHKHICPLKGIDLCCTFEGLLKSQQIQGLLIHQAKRFHNDQ